MVIDRNINLWVSVEIRFAKTYSSGPENKVALISSFRSSVGVHIVRVVGNPVCIYYYYCATKTFYWTEMDA